MLHEILLRFIASHQWAETVPFIGLMAGQPIDSTPFVTRLLETAIMSIVAAAVGIYVGVEVIKSDIAYLKQGVSEVNIKVEKVETKVEQLRHDLYVPRAGG